MTMKRSEKREAKGQLTEAATTGHTAIRWSSPTKALAARAERGHDRMTAAEYRENRLGRGRMHTSRLDLTIEDRAAALRRAARKTTRR